MTWIAESWDGKQYTLPNPTGFRLDYGLGSPCDAFSLTCPWQGGQEALLDGLRRMIVKNGTETIFTGLVDECECHWSARGALLTVSGRGMQALLLDNQAEGVDFSVLTQAELLRRYVTPYGITAVGGALPPVTGFSVETGTSCWQILCRFARFHGGVTPRFDRLGRLDLAPLPATPDRVLDQTVPVKSLLLRHKRYGAYSHVTVVNRVTRSSQTIRDEAFIKQGGCASRVFTMPRKTGTQAMRYNGQYQLSASAKERLQAELTVAEPFLASPGELIEVKDSAWPILGLWRVAESRVTLDEGGYRTELTLLPPKAQL